MNPQALVEFVLILFYKNFDFTADGVICDKYFNGSATRSVQSCPGEEYCSYVSSTMDDYDYGGLVIDIEAGECRIKHVFK